MAHAARLAATLNSTGICSEGYIIKQILTGIYRQLTHTIWFCICNCDKMKHDFKIVNKCNMILIHHMLILIIYTEEKIHQNHVQ